MKMFINIPLPFILPTSSTHYPDVVRCNATPYENNGNQKVEQNETAEKSLQSEAMKSRQHNERLNDEQFFSFGSHFSGINL